MSEEIQGQPKSFAELIVTALKQQDVSPMSDAASLARSEDEVKRQRTLAFEFLTVVGFSLFEVENIMRWHENVDKQTEIVLRGFARNMERAVENGHGVTINGKIGSGKSTIAAALAFHAMMTFNAMTQEIAKRLITVVQFADLVEMLVSLDHGPRSKIVIIDNVSIISTAELRRSLFMNYMVKRDQPQLSTWLVITTDTGINDKFQDFVGSYKSVFSRQAKNLRVTTTGNDLRAHDTEKLMKIIMG